MLRIGHRRRNETYVARFTRGPRRDPCGSDSTTFGRLAGSDRGDCLAACAYGAPSRSPPSVRKNDSPDPVSISVPPSIA